MTNYRGDARRQLERAQAELASGDAQRIKYAALELREAMESLTYSRAAAYKDEFPPEGYETWQPRKVMLVLLEIDPNADKDSTLAVGQEPSPGETPAVMHLLGTEKVLNMQTLKKHYDALGSYLHVPTLKQQQAGKPIDYAAMRVRCETIAAFIDDVLKSPVFDSTFGVFATLECMKCGKPVRKRWPDGEAKVKVKCFACGADYLVEDAGDGQCRWQADRIDLVCANPDCGAIVNPFRSEIAVGGRWDCRDCGGRNELQLGIVHLGTSVQPAEPSAGEGASETTAGSP